MSVSRSVRGEALKIITEFSPHSAMSASRSDGVRHYRWLLSTAPTLLCLPPGQMEVKHYRWLLSSAPTLLCLPPGQMGLKHYRLLLSSAPTLPCLPPGQMGVRHYSWLLSSSSTLLCLPPGHVRVRHYRSLLSSAPTLLCLPLGQMPRSTVNTYINRTIIAYGMLNYHIGFYHITAVATVFYHVLWHCPYNHWRYYH